MQPTMSALGYLELAPAEQYNRIGAGTCGVIYQQSGTNNVFKVARPGGEDPDYWSKQLWNEYLVYPKITKTFHELGSLDIDIKIPQVGYFVDKKDWEWWAMAEDRFAKDRGHFKPNSVLQMERIWPLHKGFREALMDRYAHDDLKQAALEDPSNEHCLA